MATSSKDFKVKNGLYVTNGGTFGGEVTVATPTVGTSAATKDYVDNAVGTPIIPTQSLPPENPVDGQLYFDTDSRHMLIYSVDEGDWIMIATYYDTANLPQHIHDTAIDGTGLIVSIYQDGGYYDSFFVSEQDAGYYNMNEWAMEWNGGIAIDNFN
jgi:hypothetical protein